MGIERLLKVNGLNSVKDVQAPVMNRVSGRGMPKIDDFFISDDLKRLSQIHASALTAELQGTPGIEPVLMYRAVTESLPIQAASTAVWHEFLEAAHKTRHTALAIRAMTARVHQATDPLRRAAYAHALGLYLHLIAQDDDEASRAFSAAASGSATHALAAVQALHRLHRENPMCNEALRAIRLIRDRQDMPTETSQQVAQIISMLPPNAHEERAQKYILHAKLTLLESGDAVQTFTWLETAYNLMPEETREDVIQITTAIAWAMPDHPPTLKRAFQGLKACRAWSAMRQTMAFADELGCRISSSLCTDNARMCALYLHNPDRAAEWIYRAALADPQAWADNIAIQPWLALYANKHKVFMNALCMGMKGTDTQRQKCLQSIFKSPETAYSPQKIADSIIQDPQREGWQDFIAAPNLWPEEHWIVVAQIILKYLDSHKSHDALDQKVAEIIEQHIPQHISESMLFQHIDLCIQNDVLFKQVLRMSDHTQQQREMLDKLDAAIEMYAGDTAQRNALLEKKYKTADMLGDERIKLTCLKEILEATPDHPFASHEIQKLDPNTLKPHSQILYYQLSIFIENQPQKRLEFQMALAKLYTASSQFNNAITLYHTIIDEHPQYLDARYKLVELHESQENWKYAENTLLALVNAETTPNGKYQALVKLAELQNDRMAMTSRALMTYFSALDADPAQLPQLHTILCNISEKLRSFAPLLDKYEDFTTDTYPYTVQKDATILLANIYAEYIKKPALAINVLDDFYQRGASKDQDFVQMVIDFYEEIKHWNGYIKIFSDLMTTATDGDEKALYALNLARVYANQLDDLPKAAQYATTAAQAEPQMVDHWLEIAEYLLETNALKDALVCLQNAAKLEIDPSRQTLILFEIIKLLTELELLSDACLVFHQAAHLNPPLDLITPIAEDLILLATTYRDKEAFEQICTNLILCCPASEQATLILQQALTLIRVFEAPQEAQKLIDNNLEHLTTLDLEQSLMLQQVLCALGEPKAAIQLAQSIQKQFKLNTEQKLECLNCIMQCAAEFNDTEIVRKTAETILEISPNDGNALFQLAMLDYYAGKWDTAASRLQTLIALQENLCESNALLMHYHYGEIMHASEHDDQALKSLDKALNIRADFRPAVDLKLTILLEKQRWNDALPVFRLLLELTEDTEVQGAIHKRIAEIHHFYLNDLEQAVIEYEKALALGGDVEDVPIRLLQLYQELELWPKAAMTAQILAMAQTNSPEARFEYLMVLSHIQAVNLGEISDAINTCLEAFTLKPFNQDNLTRLVPLLIRVQQWDNLNGIFNYLCGLIISKKDEALEKLIWLSQTAGCYTQCKTAIERVDKYIRAHHIDVDLIAESQKGTPAPEPLPISSQPPRKRTPTAPRGSLTYDSGLRTNPELQNPKRVSSLSMMAVPKQLSGAARGNTTNTSLKPAIAGLPATGTRQVKLPTLTDLGKNERNVTQQTNLKEAPEIPIKPRPNTLKPIDHGNDGAYSSTRRHASAKAAIASLQSDSFPSVRTKSAPKLTHAEMVQTRQNHAIMQTLAQSTVPPMAATTRATIAPASETKTSQSCETKNDVPPIPKTTSIDALPKTGVHTSSLFPPIQKQPAQLKSATQNIENIQFTVQDIECLCENAQQNKSELTLCALNDLLALAAGEHIAQPTRDLPNQMPDLTRQNLLAATSASISPGVSKLLNVLATSANSPALTSNITPIDENTLPAEHREKAQHLAKLLKIQAYQFATTPTPPPLHIACSWPPALCFTPAQLQDMSITHWIARAAFSLIMSRPESLLCATLSPSNILEHLQNITSVANAARTKTNLSIPNDTQYLQTIQDTNLNITILPRITPEMLSTLKHYAAEQKKIALHAAFILSQSLYNCLIIAAELEGIRQPNNLASLKSAMKQSQLIKGLVTFATSPNAQRLFGRIFI